MHEISAAVARCYLRGS